MATKGKPRRNRKTRPANLLAAERRRLAIELRAKDKTFVEIGKELGVSSVRAFQLVTEAMAEDKALLVTQTRELRQRQLDELAAIKGALWVPAKRGVLGAVDRLDKIWNREAKLAGLDAAEKFEHSGPNGGPIDFRAMREGVKNRLAALVERGKAASEEAEKSATPSSDDEDE